MPYEWKTRIRFSETGGDMCLTLPGLLDYFQDTAPFHAEDLGIGVHYLSPMGMAWFLAAWQITVYRYPKYYETVVIGTLPYRFRGSVGCRNFYLKTEDGELLAVADSVWTLMNVTEGRMVKPPEKVMQRFVTEERLAMDYKGRHIILPERMEEREAFVVRNQHLDGNGHVNNGQFVRMALEYLPANVSVRELRVEYKQQLRQGQLVLPRVGELPDGRVVTLETKENGICAVVAFTL